MASLLLPPARRLLQEPDSLLLPLHALANSSSQSSNPYGLNSGFNPSMAIIIVVLLSAFFFMGFFSVYIRRCSSYADQLRHNPNDPDPRADAAIARPGLDKAIVDGLPVFVYSPSKGSTVAKENMECVVCLSEFENDEVLRLLPKCGHAFHQDCIDMWLLSHTTCPLCRRSLLPEKVRSFRDLFTFGGSNRSGRGSHSGAVDQDAARAFGPEIPSQPDGSSEIQRVLPGPYASPQAAAAAAWQNLSQASRSRLGLGRKLERWNSTGHSSIKLQPPPIAPPDDEDSSDRSAVFRLPLLASDFHRSRSVTAMAYLWPQESGSRGGEETSDRRDTLGGTGHGVSPIARNPLRSASSHGSQPPLSSTSSMGRVFMRLIGMEKISDPRY